MIVPIRHGSIDRVILTELIIYVEIITKITLATFDHNLSIVSKKNTILRKRLLLGRYTSQKCVEFVNSYYVIITLNTRTAPHFVRVSTKAV